MAATVSTSRTRPSLASVLPTTRALRAYFATRVDPLTQLYLVLPLFIVYHIGVVANVERVIAAERLGRLRSMADALRAAVPAPRGE